MLKHFSVQSFDGRCLSCLVRFCAEIDWFALAVLLLLLLLVSE